MPVSVEVDGAITVVTIDRPEVRNAVDRPTAEALADAFRAFAADDAQRVAILTGAGGHFCAGADLKALAADPGRANRLSPDGDGPMGPTRMTLDKPTIAAVEGYCVAGGVELALWCDLRVAGEDATFGFFDRRWGVPLIDGGTVRLPRLIGQGRALEAVLTGRPIPAGEAYEMGLVERVTATGHALEHARKLALDLSRFPQEVMRADRRSLLAQWGKPLEEAITYEFENGIAAGASGETQAGAERFAGGAGRHGSFEDI